MQYIIAFIFITNLHYLLYTSHNIHIYGFNNAQLYFAMYYCASNINRCFNVYNILYTLMFLEHEIITLACTPLM